VDPPADRVRRYGLAAVLATLAITLAVGAGVRAPCADLDNAFRPQLPYRLCYTDITALWADRELEATFPYLEAGNEYPVGTGLLMGIIALPVSDETAFLLVNELVLSFAALTIALLLYRLVGMRALFFAAAPALAAYSFLNWDLFAIALSVGAVAALLHGRDRLAGGLAGLGVAAKIFPAFLLPGFALERVRGEDRRAALRVALWSALAWLALNAPVALLRPDRWARFFRFNSSRPVDPASLWGIGCTERMTGLCLDPAWVNLGSLVLFVAGAVAVWRLRARRDADFPRWTFAFPLMILFLLTNKVYSPQYGLWLVPWFALVLPDLRRFALWSAADLAAWAATLTAVRQVPGFEGPPFLLVKGLVLARAIALVWLLAGYVRGGTDREPETGPPRPRAPVPLRSE
jgi:uncharacterized membrane protein